MISACFILADEGMSWDKLAPIAIIAVIWVLGALFNQKKQIPRRPPERGDPQAAARQAAVLAEMLSKPRPVLAPKARRVPKPPVSRQTAAKRAPVQAPVASVPAADTAEKPRVERIPFSLSLRPGALRTRFILTEILRPPVALRDPDD